MTNVSAADFYGLLSFSTHRDHTNDDPSAPSFFQNEAAIAAISIFFFRLTVYPKNHESTIVRWIFAAILAVLAYRKESYEIITGVELFSFAAAYFLRFPIQKVQVRLVYVAVSALVAMGLARCIVTGMLVQGLTMLTPSFVTKLVYYFFPVGELEQAYHMASRFADPAIFSKQISLLFFVTFHIQVGMGFLGIEFLRREQHRRNQLVRMDVEDGGENGSDTGNDDSKGDLTTTQSANNNTQKLNVRLQRSRRFQKGVAPFILFTAFPYMAQIVFFGGMNQYAFLCVQHDMHRTIRLNELFDHDNHLIATATQTATSPEGATQTQSGRSFLMAMITILISQSPTNIIHFFFSITAYANSMDVVMTTTYTIFNRKLFSLPKVLLLPTVMAKQPWLVVQVVPFIFLSDYVKAQLIAYVTNKIEELQKQIKDLSSVRSKVEAFDMKNAELLQRSGKSSMRFTQQRWENLTVQVQARQVVSDLLSRSKLFFDFMQRNFVFGALIDCALANLLAIGKITSADTFVFSRAVEDAVDMILTRSRAEAELGRMLTEQDKLLELADIWETSKQRLLLPCHVGDDTTMVFRNLHYTRGTASVRADHVELEKGIYALTGANGSGKSTLFRVIMSCNSNDKPIDLPPSIHLLTPAEPLTEEDDIMRDTKCEADVSSEAETVPMDEDSVADDTLQECVVSEGGEQECVVVDYSEKDTDTIVESQHQPVPRISITMPSNRVFEISQNFYWPLYAKPIEFFFQSETFHDLTEKDIEERAMLVATDLHSLLFFQPLRVGESKDSEIDDEASIKRIAHELMEEKEDWFSDLSGGQKSKAELVRNVFLQEECPGVLLVDETMAPLDPASKALVMSKLKAFCDNSIIIVIYHADATEDEEGTVTECVPSSGFFDHNIHLDHGNLHIRPTC